MPSLITLSIDKTHVTVRPGASTELQATVQNLSPQLDQPALRIEGVDPAWAEVVPPAVLVFAQGRATARVIFHPPSAVEQALAGAYPVRIYASSREQPDQQDCQAAELLVECVGSYLLNVTPGEVRGSPDATYQVNVRNEANAPLQLNLGVSHGADALFCVFNPFALEVPAGGVAQSTLSVRPRAVRASGERLAVTVTGEGQFKLHHGRQVAATPVSVSTQYVLPESPPLALDISPLEIAAVDGGQYHVQIGNPGLIPVTVTLAAADSDGELTCRLDRPQLRLGPQTSDHATLTVTAGARPGGAAHDHHIRVTATPNDRSSEVVWRDVVLRQPARSVARRGWPCSMVVAGLLLALLAFVRLITMLW